MTDPIRAAIQDELLRAQRARLKNNFHEANRRQANAERWADERGYDVHEFEQQQTAHP